MEELRGEESKARRKSLRARDRSVAASEGGGGEKLRSEVSQKRDGIEKLEKEVTGFISVKEENEKRMKELETKFGIWRLKSWRRGTRR